MTNSLTTALHAAGEQAAQYAIDRGETDPRQVFRAEFAGQMLVLLNAQRGLLDPSAAGPVGIDELLQAAARVDPFNIPLVAWLRSHRHLVEIPFEVLPPATPLGVVVDELHAWDFSVVDGQARYAAGNQTRRATGGYFTPPDLAVQVARRALEAVCLGRLGVPLADVDGATVVPLVQALRVADLSCGGGAFLVAWLELLDMVLEERGLDRAARRTIVRVAAGNLHGWDVDPRALVATRTDVSRRVDDLTWLSETRHQFALCNTLLRVDSSATGQVDAAACRRHYSGELAPTRALPTLDIVLGNPPWEKVRLEERPFFRPFAPQITALTKKADRVSAIARLERENPRVFDWYREAYADYDQARAALKDGRFCRTAVGELDTYALFTELAATVRSPGGVVALIVKSSLCTTPRYRALFGDLVDRGTLLAFWDFENREKIFPIDSRERFAVVLLGDPADRPVRFRMGGRSLEDLQWDNLAEVAPDALQTLNPLTGMLPNESGQGALDLLLALARHHPSFEEVWPAANFGRIVHLTTHSRAIHRSPRHDRLPVLEGKFFEQYDGRFAGFDGVSEARRYVGKARAVRIPEAAKNDPRHLPVSRFFIEKDTWTRLTRNYPEPWSVVWRNTTSASNRRTCIATLLPHMPGTQSVQLLQLPGSPPADLALMLGVMNSLVFDWILRRKLVGIDLTQKFIRQVTVPSRSAWSQCIAFQGSNGTLAEHVVARVGGLLADDHRLRPMAEAWGVSKPVTHRAAALRELDVLVAAAYGLSAARLQEIATDFCSELSSDGAAALPLDALAENTPQASSAFAASAT